MVKLAVRIDQLAALRQACGGEVPDLVDAANAVLKGGAKLVLAHLRADRSTIEETDIADLKRSSKATLLMQTAPTLEMAKVAVKYNPRFVTLVPEKKDQQTSDGGLLLDGAQGKELASAVDFYKKKSIKVALALDAKAPTIRQARRLGIHGVRLSTHRYAHATSKTKRDDMLEDLSVAGLLVRELGLEIHAGGSLRYDNVAGVAQIPHLELIVVGTGIVASSVFVGISVAVEQMREVIEDACAVSSAT